MGLLTTTVQLVFWFGNMMHVGCGIIQGNVRCTDNGRTPSFQSSDLEVICARLLLDYFESFWTILKGNVCYVNHLRMQTMETPIWVIGSTSKGRDTWRCERGFAKL